MKKLFALLSLLVLPVVTLAQDSSSKNHGPRAGKVIGSGAVLAEVIWWGTDKLELYFLNPELVDIEEKGAQVTASLKTAKHPKGLPVKCREGKNYNFSCVLPEAKSIKTDNTLNITRRFKAGPTKTFEYRFPNAAKP